MGRYIHNLFEKFFAHRDSMIRQYLQGDLTKREYIEESYYYLRGLEVKPYQIIDNPCKAMFNYQYYNMSAKFLKLRARDIEKSGKHPEKYKEYIETINKYYKSKDYNTLRLLEMLDYENVEGYYIRVKSKELKDRLFEIVVGEFNNAVLHSTNPNIVNRMLENNVFSRGTRTSLIDDYINSRY